MALLAGAFAAAASPAVQPQAKPAEQRERLEDLSLDALIDRLSAVSAATAEMQRRLDQGVELSAVQWQRAITGLGIIMLPGTWYEGSPAWVHVRWSMFPRYGLITFTPTRAGESPLQAGHAGPYLCGLSREIDQERYNAQTLAPLPVGRHRIEFDLTIELGWRASANGERLDDLVLHPGRIAYDIEVESPPAAAAWLIAGKPAGQGEARIAAEPEKPLKELSIDELIERLPLLRFDESPAADEMARRVDELIAKNPAPIMTAAEWQKVLRRTRAILIPERWIEGRPLPFGGERPQWLYRTELTLTPVGGAAVVGGGEPFKLGSTRMMCGLSSMELYKERERQTLGVLPLGTHTLEFDVTLEFGYRGRVLELGLDPHIVKLGRFSYSVEVVKSLDEAVPPVHDAELDEAVRRSCGISVFSADWVKNGTMLSFVFDPDLDHVARFKTVAVLPNVEVLRDGVMQGGSTTARFEHDTWGIRSAFPGAPHYFRSGGLKDLPLNIASDPEEAAHWSLRISGGGEGDILSLLPRTQRWGGTVTIPVSEALELERRRMAGKPERIDRALQNRLRSRPPAAQP